MAQSEMIQLPAAAAGTGPDRGGWDLPDMAGTGQPHDQSADAQSKLDQQRMQLAIRSVGMIAARPAAPPVPMRSGAMGRISAVLASWRATERELGELPESSPDRPRLRAVVEGLRATYQRLFAERRDDSFGP